MITKDQFASMNILYSHYSLDRFLNDSKKLGYKKIELWGGTPHYSYDYPDQKEQCDKIRKAVSSYDLEIVCFTPEQCIYPFNIASNVQWIREQSVKYFSRCIEDAALLETKMMLITPGWGNFDENRDEAWQNSVESMSRLVKKAELEGIVLAYEILAPNETNLVTDLETLQQMISNFDSPNMSICVDTVPMTIAKETLNIFFSTFGKKIQHIHLNDGVPAGHMAWGDGEQSLGEHLKALDDNNYKGTITFETCDDSYIFQPEMAFEKNLEAVKAYDIIL